MRVKVTVETGPVGDHEPEVFEGNLRVFLHENSSIVIIRQHSGETVGSFSSEDFTQYTVELLEPL